MTSYVNLCFGMTSEQFEDNMLLNFIVVFLIILSANVFLLLFFKEFALCRRCFSILS